MIVPPINEFGYETEIIQVVGSREELEVVAVFYFLLTKNLFRNF